MKKWINGWRVVVTCDICQFSFWSKNIGQTTRCNCKEPKTIYEDVYRFTLGKNKKDYQLSLRKVERTY